MDPASGRPRGLGEDIDEGGHVVVGDLLALIDGFDGEARGADRLELLRGGSVHLLAGGDLDQTQSLKARMVRPDRGQLGSGVAGDHRDALGT